MKKMQFLFVIALSVFLCACAAPETRSLGDVQPAARSVPSYLASNQGCAVLLGGSVGSEFSEPEATDFWHKANVLVLSEIYKNLSGDNYKVVKVVVQPSEISQTQQIAVQELARNRCNRVLQISLRVYEDTQGRHFGYDIHLLKMEPIVESNPSDKSTGVTTRSEYQRSYRYPRTGEILRTFNVDAFALKAYQDMRTSGSLETLR